MSSIPGCDRVRSKQPFRERVLIIGRFLSIYECFSIVERRIHQYRGGTGIYGYQCGERLSYAGSRRESHDAPIRNRLSKPNRNRRSKVCIRSTAGSGTFGPIMAVVFPTGGVGRFTKFVASDDAFDDRLADRLSQLFIRVRAFPRRTLHDPMHGRQEV